MITPDVISFSFCQVSDLRLDSDASLELHLSPSQRKQRNEEALEALAEAMKVAIRNDVDAVLVPGNLFDASHLRTSTIQSVQQIFARLQELPVFICPGSLDPHCPGSPYDEASLKARGLEPWSSNVKVFGSESIETVALPGKATVRISGIGLTKENRLARPRIKRLEESERTAINTLLLPLGFADLKEGKAANELVEELKSSEYSYTALSGFTQWQNIKVEGDRAIAAATGTFCGQSRDELGPRHAFFVNLDRRLTGGIDIFIDAKEFDKRRIVKLEFNLTGRSASTVKEEFASEIWKSKIRKGTDILLLHLSGFYDSANKPRLVSDELKNSYFHLRVFDNSRPNYLQNTSQKNVIERGFIKIISQLKEKSQTDNVGSSEDLDILEDALYYGLEALRESKVSIRDAD